MKKLCMMVIQYIWAESYQVNIDFGDTPQEVTEEFYVWFTANAVKQ